MLNRLGRGLIFIAGSVVGGLALAFLIVAVRPDLIRGRSGAGSAAVAIAAPDTAAVAQVSYAAAVQRGAPSVVNVYAARLVTERVARKPAAEAAARQLVIENGGSSQALCW